MSSSSIHDSEKMSVINDKVHEVKVYLEETFYLDETKRSALNVQLTNHGLLIGKQNKNNVKGNEQIIPLKYIIGCHCKKNVNAKDKKGGCGCQSHLNVNTEKHGSDGSVYLVIYSYIPKEKKHGIWKERSMISLRFKSFDRYEDNVQEAEKWRKTLKTLLSQNKISTTSIREMEDSRSYLILLNPKSGMGKAKDTFQKVVAPMLVEADISYDLYVTKKANFARQFVRTKDIYQWKVIVICGGDGLFFEVVNGIFERPDWKDAFNSSIFGIVPCGSGNGIAKSLVHLGVPEGKQDMKPAISSSEGLINGEVRKMDLVRVETQNDTMYSGLSVGWGFIADVDIHSERIRKLGHSRFTIWSLKNILTFPTYRGKVSYLPLEHSSRNQTSKNPVHKEVPIIESKSLDQLSHMVSSPTLSNRSRRRQDSFQSIYSHQTAFYSTAESCYQSMCDASEYNDPMNVNMYGPLSNLPDLSSPLPEKWITIEDEFLMVHATIQTHLSIDCNFAPESQLNDGIIWLLIMKSCISRAELVTFLLGMTDGSHVPKSDNQDIQMVQCTAFRYEPSEVIKSGLMNVDGEKVDYGAIQGEIIPGAIKVVTPNSV